MLSTPACRPRMYLIHRQCTHAHMHTCAYSPTCAPSPLSHFRHVALSVFAAAHCFLIKLSLSLSLVRPRAPARSLLLSLPPDIPSPPLLDVVSCEEKVV